MNLMMAKQALGEHYNVMTMSSAGKMFKNLEKVVPELILLDIEMPEMNGFEALEALKENERFKNIPTIFLTGTKNACIEAKGLELGAIDFIIKPVSAPMLLERVKKHLD
jgi:putative two-component system response regulator